MCNFRQLVWLITGASLALVAVIAACAIALVSLAPWNLISLAVGIAMAAIALALIHVLVNALNEYLACRDREGGRSDCSFAVTIGLGEAARVAAATVLASMVTATAGGWIPVIGSLVQTLPVKIAWITAMLLIAMLTALLAALLSYRNCRDAYTANPPVGRGVVPVDPPGGAFDPPGGVVGGLKTRD